MNVWSDFNRKSYLAVTAHWMEYHQKCISLRADLLGFVIISDNHTGKHLAEVFLFIIDCLSIDKKVSFLINKILTRTYIIL